MENMEQLLAQHPFLQGLEPGALKLLAGCASQKHFSPNQYLFREGEETREFFLIRHGTVAMELFRARKGGITIQTRSEGDVLGWLGLPPPYTWNFDARAVTLTRTVALEVEGVLRLCEENHELGYGLLKRLIGALAQHFRMMKLQLVDMYGD